MKKLLPPRRNCNQVHGLKELANITLVCFVLFFISSTVRAQSGCEIKFDLVEHPLTTDRNLVTVSTAVNAKQSAGDGIHFTLIVKNNSGKTMPIKNMADQLLVALYNESGLDIAIPNHSMAPINRGPGNRRWKFRSETVSPGRAYVNGKAEKNDLKTQEYIEIPAGGICKVNLILKNVKQVGTAKDQSRKSRIPTTNLAPGKYKLKMFLSIVSKEQIKSGGFVASVESPMIDIEYGK